MTHKFELGQEVTVELIGTVKRVSFEDEDIFYAVENVKSICIRVPESCVYRLPEEKDFSPDNVDTERV